MDLKSHIRTIPNYPRPGIMFRDITSLLKHHQAFRKAIDILSEKYAKVDFDYIVGVESRGFIIGSALAYSLSKGFIPVRKKGKLPGTTIEVHYDLEYGSDTLEMHSDALLPGSKVIIVDDLLATGGTVDAAIKLVEQLKSKVLECCFIVDLPDLGGAKMLTEKGYKHFCLVEFEGE